MNTDSLGELFPHLLDNDAEAWRAFVARHGAAVRGRLCSTLRRKGFTSPAESAEEFLQELYCRLLVAGRGSASRRPIWTDNEAWAYLQRAIDAVVVDHRRREWRTRRGLSLERVRTLGSHGRWLELRDPGPSPEEALVVRDLRRYFLRLCRRYSSKTTRLRIVDLVLFEGWSSDEISQRFTEFLPHRVDGLIYRLRRRLHREAGLALPRRRPTSRGL